MYGCHRLSHFAAQGYGPFGLSSSSIGLVENQQEPGGVVQANTFHHQSHSMIGRPIAFTDGQFAGAVVRAKISEIQKANLGRKYAKVDRRPLDPPPVVALQLFRTLPSGENEELPIENIQCSGLLCTVDLFPVPDSTNPPRNMPTPAMSSRHNRTSSIGSTSLLTSSPLRSQAPSSSYFHEPVHRHQERGIEAPHLSLSHLEALNSSVSPSEPSPQFAGYPHQLQAGVPSGSNHPHTPPRTDYPQRTRTQVSEPEIVHYVGSVPIVEGTQVTDALVGDKFVQPTPVDWNGAKRLLFVFSDLAVKIEGTFILRYRVFDIFSRAEGMGSSHPIQAEWYGDPFKVYSTKEFPGLQPSTELTKLINRYGVRLNIRETERKRRKTNAGHGVALGGENGQYDNNGMQADE